MKITKYNVNNAHIFQYKDILIIAKRLKNTYYGNPRYEVTICKLSIENVTNVVRNDLKYNIYGYNRTYIMTGIYDLDKEIIDYIKNNYKTSE